MKRAKFNIYKGQCLPEKDNSQRQLLVTRRLEEKELVRNSSWTMTIDEVALTNRYKGRCLSGNVMT